MQNHGNLGYSPFVPMSKTVFALVDYDNVTTRLRKETTPFDTEFNLESIANGLTATIASTFPGTEETEVRLYGGWVDENGNNTLRANWLLAKLPDYRRKINGVRVRPRLATSLVSHAELMLLGTYQDAKQKMVDCMLTADAIYLGSYKEASILLASDDQDFVPAALSVLPPRNKRHVVGWLRKQIRDIPNDEALTGRSLRILSW